MLSTHPIEDPLVITISDVRFQNEVDAVHAWGGAVWRVNRPAADDAIAGRSAGQSHISESGIDSLTGIDGNLDNSGDMSTLWTSLDELMLAQTDAIVPEQPE